MYQNKALDVALSAVSDALSKPKKSPLELALEGLSDSRKEQLIELFGYSVSEKFRDVFDPVIGHTTIHSGRYYAWHGNTQLNDDDEGVSWSEAIEWGLQDLLEQEEPEEILDKLNQLSASR